MTSWQQAIDQAGILPNYIYINTERVTDNSLDSIETFDSKLAEQADKSL